MRDEPDFQDERDQTALEIPLSKLSHAALLGVIDDFVLREGTDYGDHAQQITLARKREQVLAQLKSGRACVMFDPNTETCTIVLRP